MDCPVCREPMVILELQNVEIDHCLECCGIWLDSGELELILQNTGNKDELIDSLVKAGRVREKKRNCPICGRKMEKVNFEDGKDSVLIDRCRFRHGIWFDRNELYSVVNGGGGPGKKQVLQFLRDMFASDFENENKE